MSYTILTVPFNLKEKEEGDFLKKGFEIDDSIFGKNLTSLEDKNNAFLYASKFNINDIKKASLKALVKENIFPKEKKVFFLGNLSNEKQAFGLVAKYEGINLEKKIVGGKETVSHINNTIVVLGNNPDKGLLSILEEIKRNNLILSETEFFQLFELIEKLNSENINLENVGIFDKKYQKHVESFVRSLELVNESTPNEVSTLFNRLINKNIAFNIIGINQNVIPFKIEDIEIIFNRQKTISKAIGFGFLKITLKWLPDEISNEFKTTSDVRYFDEKISEVAEFFRYYGKNQKNKFSILVNNKNEFESVISDLYNCNPEYAFLKKYKFHEEIDSNQLDLKVLVDQLLIQAFGGIGNNNFFDFGLSKDHKIIKPYILHLSNYENSEYTIITDNNFDNRIFKLIRISGRDNKVLNNEFKNDSSICKPDETIRYYVLNEGAFIIEGINTNDINSLLKKYYPAFLFALTQKYLFNYLQGKINELPLDEKSETYKLEVLKTLQQTMIYAEFSQIFTSLSNYNEIDMFFEKLREQFKIKELKKEYLASIEGISRITHLNEDEKKEETEKLNSSRLNLILLLLTIAQVWPNLYGLFPARHPKDKVSFNVIFYLLIIFIGIYFYYIHLPIKSKSGKISWQEIKKILNKTFNNKRLS
jgi:hypothetical protein